MRPIDTDGVAWRVLGTPVTPAETDEPIEMPFQDGLAYGPKEPRDVH